jgi:hypothetical protein
MIYNGRLMQTATLWERDGYSFASPVLLEPGGDFGGVHWTVRRQRFFDESNRKGSVEVSVLLQFAPTPRSVIALGNQTDQAHPATAQNPYEIEGFSATVSLLQTYTVYRARCRALTAWFPDTVTIYRMRLAEIDRGHEVQRGPVIYSGAAAVVVTEGAPDAVRVDRFGTRLVQHDAMVTVPAFTDALKESRVEVEWSGPMGDMILDGTGATYDPEQSPLLVGFPCMIRKRQTDPQPPNPWTQEFTEEFGS